MNSRINTIVAIVNNRPSMMTPIMIVFEEKFCLEELSSDDFALKSDKPERERAGNTFEESCTVDLISRIEY
jgi:hypothetical protein